MCARGYFYDTDNACKDCPIGSYCPGGNGIINDGDEFGAKTSCGAPAKTTKGINSGTLASCVAAAGYGWDGTDCSTTTNSGTKLGASYNPGYNRLKCRACPPNMIEKTTSPDHTSLTGTCTSAAGWYWDTKEKTVKKCPKGTWKSSTDIAVACTPCAKGLTTPGVMSIASTDCSNVLPGYGYASGTAALCDVDTYSAGQTGLATLVCTKCGTADGGTTGGKKGARSFTQCVAKPGFGYTAGATDFDACTGATYSAGGGRKGCTSCPGGFVESTATGGADHTAFEDTCELPLGFGTIPGSATGAAQQCAQNTFSMYPVATLGVRSAPCQACPTGTTTMGAVRKTSFDDCLITLGWGYDSATNTAQPCAKGFYGVAGSGGTPHPECVECDVGLTTVATSLASAATECVAAPGWSRSGTDPAEQCDVGYWKSTEEDGGCTQCTGSWSTATIGATSVTQCTVCVAGYGGASCTQCATNSYSPANSATCTTCPDGLYSLAMVSRAGSVAETDCIERMGAVAGGYDYIYANGDALTITSGGSTAVVDATAANVGLCAAACNSNAACMYFYYATGSVCKLVLAASDTNAVKVGVKVDANTYTRWNAPYGAEAVALPLGSDGTGVGIDAAAHTGITAIADCEALCEAAEKCVLYVWTGATNQKCFLRVGAFDPAIAGAGVKALPDNFGLF